jgi:ferrous iron transport protein B
MSTEKSITIALAGNPNSGKSTIFNKLTGVRQHIGNYPGVTVEYKEGFCNYKGEKIRIIDLPGTYSLTAYSEEERIARDYIVSQKADVVICVMDASNLERHLYLAVQLKELGLPLVLAFNMSDMAEKQGYKFDLKKISEFLYAKIVCTIGSKGCGIDELLETAVSLTDDNVNRQTMDCSGNCAFCSCGNIHHTPSTKEEHSKKINIKYDDELEDELCNIEKIIKKLPIAEKYEPKWLAIKLLEKDPEFLRMIEIYPKLKEQIEISSKRIKDITGEPTEMLIAEGRYGFISGICHEAVRSTIEQKRNLSDKIDSILLHKLWGFPIFLGMMYLVFWTTFTVGGPPMEWIDSLFGWLSELTNAFLKNKESELLRSFLVDGVIGGVGGVIIFLPNIILLFLCIGILEASGYMARAAFIMDKLMNKIGLHGKSFIPLLLGFGCTIPAIMATRTIETKRDRIVTMLIAPLISCGARLPIYMLIIPAFFPENFHAPLLWSIYIIGILFAIIAAKILRCTVFKGENVPFVMELPPYRLPTLRGLFLHAWEKSWLFLRKAGTLILGISVLLWIAATFPKLPENISKTYESQITEVNSSTNSQYEEETLLEKINNKKEEAALAYSFAGRIGKMLEPIFTPIGFDWKLVTPVLGAVAAKEVFVSNLGIIFSVGEADEESKPLREKLRARYSPLQGLCILLFMLIVAPCMATFAIMKSESSWKWAIVQFAGLSLLAYFLTMFLFQVGTYLQINQLLTQ